MAHRQVTVLQGPPALLLHQLRSVTAADDVTEARRRLTSRAGCTLLALGVVGLFISPMVLEASTATGRALITGGILALVAAIVLGILWRGYRARDLDDERLGLVGEITGILKADVSDKTPMVVTLRHGDCFEFGAASNQRTEGGILGGRVHFSDHEDPWLLLRARLQDGSVLSVRATEEGKRKRKPKRKYQKIKDRIREKVTVALRLRPEAYPHLERLQPALDGQRLSQHAGLGLTQVQVEGSTVRVGAVTGQRVRLQGRAGAVTETGKEHVLTAPKLASLLAFVYSGLAQCRGEGG